MNENSGILDKVSPFDAYRARTYLPELDGIRGLAVILVISFHLKDPMARWFAGYLGVTIFFVLSGYLITRLGLAEERRQGSVNIASFFVRRIFRLMPLYYLVLALYVVMYLVFGWSPERKAVFLQALPYYLVYCQEFPLFSEWGKGLGVPFVHSWTLGIEEKYYLVWPFLAFLAWRKQGPIRLWGTLLLAMAMALAPAILGPEIGRFFFSYSHILVGCFVALLLDDPRGFARLSWLGHTPVVWLVLLAFLLTHHAYRYFGWNHVAPYHNVYSVVTALALMSILLSEGVITRFLSHPILVKVGKLSYAMYLIHGFALKFAEKIAPPDTGSHLVSLATLVLAVLISLGLAFVLSMAIERPMIDLGRRLSQRIHERAEVRRTTETSSH